jgi:hypothetical protein
MNFQILEQKDHHIELGPDMSVTIKGCWSWHILHYDVAVPIEIVIAIGEIITVPLDDGKTNHYLDD